MERIRSHCSTAILLCLSIILLSCSAVEVNDDSAPEVQFKDGKRLLEKGRTLEAIDRFRVLKSRHPYHPLAPLAALQIGEAYFEQNSYMEANAAYRIFLHLHPTHEKAPYAIFRMGKSRYEMLPGSVDRDLYEAKKAIQVFKKLIASYPKSEYVQEAKELIQKLRKKLMEKEMYVGNFYFKKKYFQAAANRYIKILEEYKNLGLEEKALYLLSLSYLYLEKKERAKKIFLTLKRKYKNSPYNKKLATKLEKI